MILGIHGSRTLKDERVKIILLEEIERHQPEMIVTHAEPDGVCDIARRLCRDKAIPLKLHFLNFKFLRGAFEKRSKAVLKDSDYGIFIHDGKSVGTSNEIKLAVKMGLEHVVHTLEITKYKHSTGFTIDKEWEDEVSKIEAQENPLSAAELDAIKKYIEVH